jgi:(p)ppGpp synthase/HD superfamily hydrolase
MFEKDPNIKDNLKAMLFALKTHHSVRQSYNDKYPYYFHLKMVVDFCIKFGNNLSAQDKRIVFLGCLFHDIIEDCRLTYNDVKLLYGADVADVVFLCTDLRGKNRAERHGPEFIKGLQSSRLATYVKICDVCANMTMGKITGSRMLSLYQKDYQKTKNDLNIDEFNHIFKYIEDNLL